MIEVSTPGKLYIAGEYAVVEPGHPAILAAVDQFINVTIENATENGSIQSQQYSDLPIRWTRRNGELVLDHRENPFHYILAAIRLTERYAKEQGTLLSFYHLKVTSELDNSSGRKYGLGSSGAVTVGTVKALNLFYDLQLDPLMQFKIAALAHLAVQGNGSCGDIAASCFGGWLAFSTFDHEWVKEKQDKWQISDLLESDWPKLSIQPLQSPKNMRLLIGWTGSPASTSDLVDQVNRSKEDKDDTQKNYEQFLADSNRCVEDMIDGFTDDNVAKIKKMITKNRQLLKNLSKATNVVIETPALKQLCDLAEACGGASKSSGAGGGDCGIVIADQKTGILPLMSKWEKADIIPLPLHVYHYRGGIK
ncbi:phosphomevalonate kinase [Tetragenococcus koreensis]|uniref:phosphomevalonate kinase n=1 Tax=Tetragenococcus koreensis TaxID=290335 RepID=A0AAN4RKN2_9ENTE|nr:phosphomevalonate kinase [Tetragenococcus koreensis]AYW46157.1 phosphomevalonate kinase [Tetragenococcus koreensis]MCF1617630.1 phosphomevalonate kinase [Tetragenococcus koreensis]MCF1620337.1 phosphomevalonate kinase [Tetragenococcus koreensis]MCF1622417.1 phosphomevalonate kinase [Tetragenococcus koreensis]MCF1627138.1 phosphomevalonate kinase [Tetragenococcus koreensis]